MLVVAVLARSIFDWGVLRTVLAVLILIHIQHLALLVRGYDDVVDIAVELLHDVYPRVDGQLRVEDTAADAKLLKEQLQSVRPVDIRDKDYTFPLDQLELEDDVRQQELFVLAAPGRLLENGKCAAFAGKSSLLDNVMCDALAICFWLLEVK